MKSFLMQTTTCNILAFFMLFQGINLPCYGTQGDLNEPEAGLASVTTEGDTKAWWLTKPMRLVQTNLREIDATLDVETYMQHVRQFNAEVVMINVGGIVANYPTELAYQYLNPRLRGDLVGGLIDRLHADGIRVIGRFDFSKVNETIAAKNPEWLYKGVKGEFVNYNGQVHTCVNGGYQQEYLFKILGEAIERYPLSGNYHGICQSDACRKRFRDWCGLELPVAENPEDEAFRKYKDFCQKTSDELFYRVKNLAKSKRAGIAVCTYTDAGVDIIRNESNSAFDRPLPEWNYSASDNVRTAMCSWRNKAIGNVAINFPDYRCRHSSVSPYLTELRLVGNMLNDGWLDYCVIGTLENQEDRLVFDNVRDVFGFHAENERWLTNTKPVADVALIKGGNRDEYKGLFRILSEEHILFDVISTKAIGKAVTPRPLEDYQLLVLPDIRNMSDAFCARLDAYVKGGGKILATGRTSTCDELGNPLGTVRLKSAGLEAGFKVRPHIRGTYLRIRPQDKKLLKDSKLDALDIVYLDSEFLECEAVGTTERLLGYIMPAMFGPPERCYYTQVTDMPGLFHSKYGKGSVAFFPWQLGQHYRNRSHHGHSLLIKAGLEGLLKLERSLVAETSPLVEVNRRVSADGKFEWVGLINHSGQNGTAFHKTIPISDIGLKFRAKGAVKAIRLLRAGKEVAFQVVKDGWVKCVVPKLERFEIVLCEHE
ncbi:MAG: alpha-amylase family protein [Planctomycetota bacterium]